MKQYFVLSILLLSALSACKNGESQADAWGNFEVRETIISAQVAGKLLYHIAERGQLVDAGTLVGLVDTTNLALNHKLIEVRKLTIQARFADIDANIAVLGIQRNNTQRELERARRMLADQASTRQIVDELEGKVALIDTQIEAAKVSRNAVRAELQALDAQLAISKEQLNNCYIINPLQGTVLETYANSYEIVGAGKPLYKIADLSVMDLKVFVSGNQLSGISIGQKVTVFYDGEQGELQQLEGVVNWISSRAEFTPKTIQTKEERVSQVYAVKISVSNDGRLKIGMPGEAKF